MIHPQIIAGFFERNYDVIKQQVDGLTHEDSLLQLPFRGNCLNWVLGHIVANRNRVLALLGEPPIWTDEETAAYKRGSTPITSGQQAHRLEKILEALDCSQERLIAALNRATPEDMELLDGQRTIGQRLAFLGWHEGYHTGQTEYLRQLAGKNDAVIQ